MGQQRRPAATSCNDPNTRCLCQESRAAGCRFAPERMLRRRLELARLNYKDFAEQSEASATMFDGRRMSKQSMAEMEISRSQEPQFAAFVGIDWADQKQAWCLQAAGSTQRQSGELEHKVETVEAWVAQLCQRFGGKPIAVALEQTKGALVYMLAKYDCLHLFPVPSTMVASLRDALYPSGAKDDPRDADLVLDLLVQHRDKLRRLSPDSEASRRVQNLVEERRKLVDEKTAHIHRVTSYLKIYFPQMLDWFEDLDTELVCVLLARWPTLEELQKTTVEERRTFFHQHHCRNRELIERRIQGIGQAKPAIQDRAVIEAKVIVVKVLVQLIHNLREVIVELDGKIAEASAAHPDFFIFASLPAAGDVMAPRLLAAFGSQRERYGSANDVQKYSGIAPVTETSGKKKWVHSRWACPKFLRQSFHEWAGHSIAKSKWARAY